MKRALSLFAAVWVVFGCTPQPTVIESPDGSMVKGHSVAQDTCGSTCDFPPQPQTCPVTPEARAWIVDFIRNAAAAEAAVGRLPDSVCACVHAHLERDGSFSDITVTRATNEQVADQAVRTVQAMNPLPTIPTGLSCIFDSNPWYMSFGGRQK